MNPLLQNKINELDQSSDFECWYLVKHNPDFCNLCYLVDALDEFIKFKNAKNVEDAINERISAINVSKGLSLSNNYRALRVAAFLGLIKMVSVSYSNAIITEVFYEIKDRCSGEFEKNDLYIDIICRQVEKLYTASSIDEGYNGVRKNYRIYPVMFLYKVLVEFGKVTGDYSISQTEYAYLVATTKRYEDYLETMFLIKLLRDEPDAIPKFTKFRMKFDNRMNMAIKLLTYLEFTSGRIRIKNEYILDITKKVYDFENSKFDFKEGEYIDFLCSKKSFFNYYKNDDEINEFNNGKEDSVNKDEPLSEFDFFSSSISDGQNLIVYGTPGCGKSYYVQNTLLKDYKADNCIRTTFFQDYTNTDFVGQILPVVDGEKVTYNFNPGPFSLALEKAIRTPNEKVALVIEELNRGSAASIFGDIFQLLDRKNGVSEYSIINVNIINYLKEKFDGEYTFKDIRLPSNLSIFATMNTSDQNVFTLDTAFKRRWKFKKLINKFEENHSFKSKYIPGPIGKADFTWEEVVNAINEYILEVADGLNSEDKQIGVYFIDEKGMREEKAKISTNEEIETFAYKVFEYLWDDVAKFSRSDWFGREIKSLDQLVEEYKKKGVEVFNDDIFKKK